MKLKMLVYITLLLVLSAGVVQAEEITPLCPDGTLYRIGEHRVYRTYLDSPEDLWKMMRTPKVWSDIEEALNEAKCPGTRSKTCLELIKPLKTFFYEEPKKINKVDEKKYSKDDSIIFRWMMFRPNGKSENKIKIAENIKWGGVNDLAGYQFDIKYREENGKERTYTFAVPKGCGNLALLKVTECPECDDCTTLRCKECSKDCKVSGKCESENCKKCREKECFDCNDWDCEACSAACIKNPGGVDENGNTCPSQCAKCKTDGCVRLIEIDKCVNCDQCKNEIDCLIYGKNCSPKCKQCKKDECIVGIPIEDCSDWNCKACSAACIKNPYGTDENGKTCPSQCATCKAEKCVRLIDIDKCVNCDQCKNEIDCLIDGKNCSPKCEKCKTDGCVVGIPSEDCSDWKCEACSAACIKNPDGVDKNGYKCPSQCTKCKVKGCLRVVTEVINCIPPCPPSFHFIADLGYYRQSDPADYLFGRAGIEYNLSGSASWLEGVSLLTMIGAAPKIGGSDGDSGFQLDVIAQYNWLQSSIRGFTGLGLGGWFTSGDTEDDSGDSDLDIIANIGVRVLDNPNMSIFLEMRNAVDELDSISEYGRFGAGVRFQF
ncbi:MAG: hypothetical protein QTN59_12270 [Candidatus Electrothrix communis]|nr:MAG: hypothetical protein QTN59_12270 [Candidatus Electrothrix communis]